MNRVPFAAAACVVIIRGILTAQELPRTMYVLNGWGANSLSTMNMETGTISNNCIRNVGVTPNQILSFNDRIYLVNSVPDEIRVLDPMDDPAFLSSIPLPAGSNPWSMAPVSCAQAYVTNQRDSSISRLDLTSGQILKRIPVGPAPQGIVVVDNEAWITNTNLKGWSSYGQGSVSLVDIITDSVIAGIPVPVNPQMLAKSPDPDGWGGTYIHVLCTGDYAQQPGRIAVINRWAPPSYTAAVVDTIEIGGQPGDLVITPAGKGYCCAWGDEKHGHIYVYDACTGSVLRGADTPIPVGAGASRLHWDPVEACIWITCQTDGTVQRFSTETDTVTATYPFGMSAMDLAIMEPLGRPDPWPDRVAAFTPGPDAGFGANYFPANILGPPDPDPAVNATNPSNKPQEILSLGTGGSITLEFTDNIIVNGPGPDFTIFENCFQTWSGDVYIEAAIVSVSQDGLTWVTFPWDTLTGSGLAGMHPILDNQHPEDPALSGGDQFDLDAVGLDWISFITIRDMGDIWQEPSGGGDFDLDAVVAVHASTTDARTRPEGGESAAAWSLSSNYPNPFNARTTVEYSLPRRTEVTISVYSVTGRRIRTLVSGTREAGIHRLTWDGTDSSNSHVASGIYICRMNCGEHTAIQKMTLLK
ncbi:T9SS type A sorting domain-containing protein [bacterium]|nr:T9SS type A sorting domain-containing protein [bacterium]